MKAWWKQDERLRARMLSLRTNLRAPRCPTTTCGCDTVLASHHLTAILGNLRWSSYLHIFNHPHRASMPSESSQTSPITGGDEIVASNQPVNACVANIDIDRTDLTATYSCYFLDRHSSPSRCMNSWSIGSTFSLALLRQQDRVNWQRHCQLAL